MDTRGRSAWTEVKIILWPSEKKKKRRNKEANNAWKSKIRTWISKGATTPIILSISLLSCFSFFPFSRSTRRFYLVQGRKEASGTSRNHEASNMKRDKILRFDLPLLFPMTKSPPSHIIFPRLWRPPWQANVLPLQRSLGQKETGKLPVTLRRREPA